MLAEKNVIAFSLQRYGKFATYANFGLKFIVERV